MIFTQIYLHGETFTAIAKDNQFATYLLADDMTIGALDVMIDRHGYEEMGKFYTKDDATFFFYQTNKNDEPYPYVGVIQFGQTYHIVTMTDFYDLLYLMKQMSQIALGISKNES